MGGLNLFRKGRFAVWQGKEYELVSYQRQYYLSSKERQDLQNGFFKPRGDGQTFYKDVSIRDLDDAYEIVSYTMISSYRFAIEGYNEKTGNVALVTNNPFVKEKIAVRPYGKYEYIIEIPLGEITIEEDRIPILGFEKLYL